jgi:ArsR family transcriptional regulator, lead/cadmium/zinc/bismuth-responsive transcriptional repressor
MADNRTVFSRPTDSPLARAVRKMPEADECGRLAEFYSAFADAGRVRIMSALRSAGELCVGDLATVVNASESAISHQLKTLRLLRLVTTRNEGRKVFYRLDDDHIHEILRAGTDHVRERMES